MFFSIIRDINSAVAPNRLMPIFLPFKSCGVLISLRTNISVVSAKHNRLCLSMTGNFSQVQSTSNAAVSRGLLSRSKTEQSLKSGHGLITPIMPKDKLVEVNLELRGADSMIGTDQPLLEVADSTVGQGHYGFGSLTQFGCLRLRPRDVPIPGFVQTRKTLQRIGVERRTRSDMLLDKATERGCLKIDRKSTRLNS